MVRLAEQKWNFFHVVYLKNGVVVHYDQRTRLSFSIQEAVEGLKKRAHGATSVEVREAINQRVLHVFVRPRKQLYTAACPRIPEAVPLPPT